ncbi:MAG TPA: SLC13 family permease [Alphaproteobacteria bacterium]|nr:SLC13 family permease [Alphaproteobacteria bacterium]
MNEMRKQSVGSREMRLSHLVPGRSVLAYGPAALLLCVIAALWAWSQSGAPSLVGAAILIAFVIACWVFGIFAEPVTSFIFILLVVLFHISKPEVVLSGFTSPAWWLVFGGSIIAIAVQTTGLGRRLAGTLFARSGGSYPRAVAAVALAAVGLAFVMPSTNGRILLLTPIVLAFAEHLGLGPGRPGHTGLVVTVAAASYMPPTTILPANVPNSILLGASQSLYGIELTYGPYLLLHFPILGALKTAALIWLVCRLFPEPGPLNVAAAGDPGPMSAQEKRLTALLLLSLLLFATDFIHGISPAWISLGTGILCMLPPITLVTPKAFSERINLSMLVYIGGILGLGAVVSDTGLGQLVAARLMAWAHLTSGHTVLNLATLFGIGAGLGALVTATGLPAVLTPLAKEFADASGLPLLTVLMLQVPVFSTVFLPFESPPMMVGLQVGGVSPRPAGKLCLALAAVTLVVLLPLDYLWWRLLGYLP